MQNSFQPRRPTGQELKQLQEFVLKNQYTTPSHEEQEEEWGLVSRAYIAVFDHYTTDSVGYSGKVMMVVWPASPGLYDIYYWEEGELHYQEQG